MEALVHSVPMCVCVCVWKVYNTLGNGSTVSLGADVCVCVCEMRKLGQVPELCIMHMC